MRVITLAVTLLAVSVSALAVGYDSDKWQSQCRLDEPTQAELNQCAERHFQARDAELNRVYSATMQSLPDGQRERLREEQRAWLKSRDSDCVAQTKTEAGGGSIGPMLYELCRAEATEHRTRQLRNWAH